MLESEIYGISDEEYDDFVYTIAYTQCHNQQETNERSKVVGRKIRQIQLSMEIELLKKNYQLKIEE